MKKSLALGTLVVAMGLFTGCSNKINLTDFRPAVAQKNDLAPKNLTEHKQKKAAIIEFKSYKYNNVDASQLATNQLKANLTQSKFIKISKVLPKKDIDKYVKLVEVEQQGGDTKTENYIIQDSIQSISYTPTYHPIAYIKTKKGTIVIPPYWSYDVCTDIQTDILNVPSLQSAYSDLGHTCISHDGGNNQAKAFFPYLINESVKEAVSDSASKIKKFVAPKGYILEVKKNGDDSIIKISLGSKQGVHKGMNFVIYDLQKDSDTGDINKYKIGTAEVGDNTIWKNTSWATVDLDDNQELKIGDLIEPNLEKGFLGNLGTSISRSMK